MNTKILSKIGEINEKEFCVKLFSLPINVWDKFLTNWTGGFICLGPDFAVNISSKTTMHQEKTVPQNPYFEHFFTGWGIYYSKEYANQNSYSIIKQYDKNAQKNHFKNMEEYLSVVLQIDEQEIDNDGREIVIAPVYFKVTSTIFDEKSVSIRCKGFAGDKGVVVIDFYKNRGGSNPYVWKDRKKISYEITGDLSIVQEFTITDNIDNISIEDGYKITVHRSNGVIVYETIICSIGDSWLTKSSITNPILGVFQKFVSSQDIRKILFEFEGKGGKKSNDNFEKGISWLLSLLGLSAIWLGKEYEHTGANENRTSLDLLGSYDSKYIILANATIGIPDSSDFSRERRYRENVAKAISNPEVKLRSLLFCGASVKSLQNTAKENDVILIGKDDLLLLLDYVEKGDVDIAREYLIRANINF